MAILVNAKSLVLSKRKLVISYLSINSTECKLLEHSNYSKLHSISIGKYCDPDILMRKTDIHIIVFLFPHWNKIDSNGGIMK